MSWRGNEEIHIVCISICRKIMAEWVDKKMCYILAVLLQSHR